MNALLVDFDIESAECQHCSVERTTPPGDRLLKLRPNDILDFVEEHAERGCAQINLYGFVTVADRRTEFALALTFQPKPAPPPGGAG